MELELIEIAVIVNAHGIRGEVRVQPVGQTPDFLLHFKTFYLDGAAVTPSACHRHKSLVLMKLPGVDDMNAALALKGKILSVKRGDCKLPAGVYFDDELVGLTVQNADSGAEIGKLTEVALYPAHKVYTVVGAREYLIPAVPGVFIEKIDLAGGTMTVHLLEGMATDEN